MARPHRPPTIHHRLQIVSEYLQGGGELAAIEAEVTKQVWDELEVLRQETVDELNTMTLQVEIDKAVKLLGAIEQQQAQLQILLEHLLTEALDEAWHAGEETPAKVAKSYGLEIHVTPFISKSFLEVSVTTLPDLIQGLSQEYIADVGRILRRAALAKLTPMEVMQQLGTLPPLQAFDPKTGKFRPLTDAELRRAMAAKGPYAKLFRRLEAITRTEIGRIAQTANYLTMRELSKDDPRWMKEWSAVIDSRTRPDHVALDGERVLVDEAFHVNGETLRYPHDPGADASETVNCRCSILPYHPAFEDVATHNEVPDSFGRTTFRPVVA